MGPLLFAATLQPILTSLKSEIVLGYLDDVAAGGDSAILCADFDNLRASAAEIGLALNIRKCEVICSESDAVPRAFDGFRRVSPGECELLGAPLLAGAALEAALAARCGDLARAITRLPLLASHDALLILKYSISAPKLLYTLRCSPCSGHTGLVEFDRLLRVALSSVTNVEIDDLAWVQAGLPVCRGGLGVRSVVLLAPSAFLASAAATRDLQDLLLPAGLADLDPSADVALSTWSERHPGILSPLGSARGKQRAWDEASIQSGLNTLMNGHTDPYHKARLLAVQSNHSGDWLNAWPISACGLRLDDEAIKVAVGLRLGSNLCVPHLCSCGAMVDARGSHGLSCRRSAGRQTRHAQLNDAIHRTLIRAGYPATKEPTGLMQTGDCRPDGCTLVAWKDGMSVAWDATVPDTLAPSHLADTCQLAGAAAEKAANLKSDKYCELRHNYIFCPVAIETMGPINGEGEKFLSLLGKRLTDSSGDPRECAFLFQRISIIVQRCNSISFSGTFLTSLPAS